MCTVLPPNISRRDAALGTVSVVMMASAASAQWSGRASASAAGNAASMRSMRQRFHDHAGGKGQHLRRQACPCARPARRRCERARARPSAPVPALALPVLTSDGADALAGGQVLAAQQHRCGAETVGGEDAGDAGAFGQRHHGQVAAVGLAHAGHGHADLDALHGVQGRRIGGKQVDGHDGSRDKGSADCRNPRQRPAAGGRGCLRPACRGSSCTSCRCRRGRARCGRPSAPASAAGVAGLGFLRHAAVLVRVRVGDVAHLRGTLPRSPRPPAPPVPATGCAPSSAAA